MSFPFVRDFLAPASACARRPRPRLEVLEDRCLLSGGIALTPSEPAPQLVGQPVTWTATVADAPPGTVYQFSVGAPGGPFQVARDFSPDDHFTWAPMREGTYRIRVAVKDGFAAADAQSAVVPDEVDSRVTGGEPVISPTANPLVALYSVPPGPKGTVHVEFAAAGDNPSWRSTDERPSLPARSTNFFIAGMLPNTTYEMRNVFSDGTASAPRPFTTGGLPPNLAFPSFTVRQPPGPGSDLDQDMFFHQFPNAPGNVPNPLATDLSGRVVWYYDVSQSGLTRTYVGQSLAPGGTVLVLGVDAHAPLPGTLDVLREVDLAGDVVRETNIDAVNAQLSARGYHPIYSFTHDVERLPNGGTAVLAPTERLVDVNGTPAEYVGMTVLVLDANFQVAWAWDAFDHLDVNRGPVLGEVLQPGGPDQLTASTPVLPAVDWLHVNAVSWSPADENLVLSVRHQDWVVKIAYANGAGDGHVVWRLGQGGDFTVNSTDPSPWFSHQHNAHHIDASTLILFDNGNTRRASDPTADSRGQVWKLDERTMTATLVLNVDLGNYSMALGSAQRLSNGNYVFTSGFQGQAPNIFGQSIEVRPDGSTAYVLEVNRMEYRALRVRTLYEGVSDQLAGAGGGDTSQPCGDPRTLSSGGRERGGGPLGAPAPADDAGRRADHSTGTGASLAPAGTPPDDFRPAGAAALTASSGLLALPPAPPAWPPAEVRRLDQLFAGGLEDGAGAVLFRSKRGLTSFGDEDGADAAL
jgi:arylsulfate sulfotransferase